MVYQQVLKNNWKISQIVWNDVLYSISVLLKRLNLLMMKTFWSAMHRSNICLAIDPFLLLQFSTNYFGWLLQACDFEMCNNMYSPANNLDAQSFIHFLNAWKMLPAVIWGSLSFVKILLFIQDYLIGEGAGHASDAFMSAVHRQVPSDHVPLLPNQIICSQNSNLYKLVNKWEASSVLPIKVQIKQ